MRSSGMMRIRRKVIMPDNSSFYHLAYIAATAIYVGYALLLIARRKKARARQKIS